MNKRLILNPDKEYTLKIINSIYKNDGYCPCKIVKNEKNKCPCEDMQNNKICHCELFINIGD